MDYFGSNFFFTQGRETQDSFAFDKVFGMETEQQEIFEYSIKSIVDGEDWATPIYMGVDFLLF
jgi:hypothetical protein